MAATAKLTSILISTLMISSVLASHAQADRGQVVRANHNGMSQCKTLGSSDTPFWKAKIRGALLDGGRGGTDYRFRITSCFASKEECKSYIDNIDYIIHGVDIIRSRKCNPQS